MQSDVWWEGVTLPMLEKVRRDLRDLVKLIEKERRKPVYADFEDVMGTGVPVPLPGFDSGTDFEKFRSKARAFLRTHQDNLAVRRLRMNQPLTRADLAELARILAESGAGGEEEIRRAEAEAHGLGLFVRSLVGLDRTAARKPLRNSWRENP